MSKHLLTSILFLIGAVICMEEDNNEIVIGSSIKPPINLDTNLRKALLKALIELENEDKEKYDRNTSNDYVNIITHLDNKGKNIEKASATALSYITKSEPFNMTITVKKTTSKPKQIFVQKNKSSTERQTFYDKDDLDVSETPEHFVASASSSFTSSKVKPEKINGQKISSDVSILNSLTPRIKESKLQFKESTTVRPITSTEESEANVESLQFFSAPLVAAFTVHQDEKGLPKRVVPIYNQPTVLTSVARKQLEKEKKGRDGSRQDVSKQQESNDRRADELRQKQKKLEDEIKRLTKLQEEQERIIKEQKFAYEQKIFEQQKKLFAEQTRYFSNVQPFVPIITTTPKTILHHSNQPNNFESSRNTAATLVSIQPSLGFAQTSNSASFPFNAQILPVKNAIDFRTPFAQNLRHFRDQDSRPLNTGVPLGLTVRNFPSANPIQQPLATFRHNTLNNDLFQGLPSVQHNNVFRQIPSMTHITATQNLPFTSLPPSFRVAEITPQQHGTRSLRQETGTGNFLNQNRLNTQNGNSDLFTDHRFNRNPLYMVGVSQPTEFSRSNTFGPVGPMRLSQYNTLQYSVDEPFLNQRLNNLLYFSGLSQGRQQEDLNIVSKVLSLNHIGGGDSQLASSSVDSPIIRPSTIWRNQ